MSYVCDNCGYNKLTGKEKDCPKCGMKITYKCTLCGVELPDGPGLCPSCQKEWDLNAAKKRKRNFTIAAVGLFLVAGVYGLSPLDIIPDALIGIGSIDDIAVILLSLAGIVGSVVGANKAGHVVDELESEMGDKA